MGRKLLVFIGIIIILMLGLNIFIYNSNSNTSSTLKENVKIQDQISQIDDFRTYVVDMGHMQKLYILTKDNKYKLEYENHLSNTYLMIDDLNNNKYINDVDKMDMDSIVNSYRDANIEIFSKLETIKDYNDVKDDIIESDKIQISLLHKASLAIASVNDSSEENNSSAIGFINIQTKITQVFSTLITALTAIPLYYYKKKYNKENIEVADIVDSIIERKPKEEEENINSSTISKEELLRYRKKLEEHSLMISYANLLVRHNENMEMQWKESKEILEQLEYNIKNIQIELDKICKEYDTDINIYLQEYKLQLFQLKLLFQQLPQYHKLVIELVNNMINETKN